tara:strand:+ start:39 stop:797 length:759 start_codon:yes stop_codon:yes gene_type:complete
MALTEIPVELSSTPGIADSSNATAITIDSSEKVGIGTGSDSLTRELTVKLAGQADVSIVGATNQYAQLLFGDTDADNKGIVAYDNTNDNLELWTSGAAAFRVDSDGHIRLPKQSAFLAIQSVAVNNIATDASDHNIGYGNEIFDQNADYNNSTYTFTAPITGRYQLQSLVYLSTVDADCTYIILRIKTSNRNYSAIMRPDFGADLDRFHLTNAVLADMDASDTAVCTISQYEGTAQMDAVNSTGYFSGYLVA